MAEAIFGLIGVVIGALVTGGISFFADYRKEAAELRAALRVFDDELGNARSGIDACLKHQAWHPRIGTIELDEWPGNRAVLAARLNSIDWLAASSAAAAVQAVAMRGVQRLATGEEPTPLADDDEPMLKHAKETIEKVRGMLATIHSPAPGLVGLLMWARAEKKRGKAGIDSRPPPLPGAAQGTASAQAAEGQDKGDR